ncbi:MAG: hypothetical protein GY796_11735 [Chloroflexi bacterium]|nr:hypothetical protein [Chloroflexota bacterium]
MKIIGLLLAILAAAVASFCAVYLFSISWEALGILSVVIIAVSAFTILTLGAMLYMMLDVR